MIKNIMKNIGTEKAGMPKKLKQAYIDHAKKIGVDSLESLIRNKDKAYVDYNDEIAQIYADELKARNPQHLEEEAPAKKTEKDASDTLSLEEVIKAKNDRIAELSKAHPNEWAMNGRNTDFDKIVENDPVIKKLDSFKF